MQDEFTPITTLYALTPYDYPLLIKAGFHSQGISWDVLWARDNEGVLWQVSCDEDQYLRFYQHHDDLRRENPRSMTRQEFLRRFGV